MNKKLFFNINKTKINKEPAMHGEGRMSKADSIAPGKPDCDKMLLLFEKVKWGWSRADENRMEGGKQTWSRSQRPS